MYHKSKSVSWKATGGTVSERNYKCEQPFSKDEQNISFINITRICSYFVAFEDRQLANQQFLCPPN